METNVVAASLADQSQREQALDTRQSFIMQAPAGSGKTELLTQRYLALLACVQNPEEVIALTFTRKAAAEMRSRVLEALELAQHDNKSPEGSHKEKTWLLARNVLRHETVRHWNLLSNPTRLRIQTIDALCANLTRQMPVLSRFGAQPQLVEDAFTLYRTAARNLISTLESNNAWTSALSKLLLHLDNNYFIAEKLLSGMLALREQWLPYCVHGGSSEKLRCLLEKNLQHVINNALGKIRSSFPKENIDELLLLIRFAAKNLNLPKLAELNALPSDCHTWLMLSDFLLTKDNQWREKINKNQGFPTSAEASDKSQKTYYREMKQRMENLLARFNAEESLHQSFIELRQLPPPHYTDHQWEILAALFELLPVLVAQLQLLFQSNGIADYSAIAQNALIALGDPQTPTDLALALDYKIQHILIDEFQDTSVLQFRLLERLTAGWQPQDSRTIFLVGDPMQSIYRFRKAEVGLFLRAKEKGIGSIPLKGLTLCTNFRSRTELVDWFNQTFQRLLPANPDIQIGAVPYTPSIASQNKEKVDSPAVYFHAFAKFQTPTETEKIKELIQTHLIKYPGESIAILVRARSHLREILPGLQEAGIAYRAIEIDTLAERPIIQDLYALTRALLHPGDRTAWLAVLRAPWCGLTLRDLHTIANENRHATILELALNANPSSDAQQRLNRVLPIFQQALQQRHRQRLAYWIKGVWLALGGPACLKQANDLENAAIFFKLLNKLEQGGDIPDMQQLVQQLNSLFAAPSSIKNAGVEIMTIHKAKGLEFDHVILPGLEHVLTTDAAQLLLCAEQPTPQGNVDFLLAPIKAHEEEQDPIYHYLRTESKKAADYETVRLLYVAATRAKKTLHLCGTFTLKDNQIQAPALNTLLAFLWPAVAADFQQALRTTSTVIASQQPKIHTYFQRLIANWQLPDISS